MKKALICTVVHIYNIIFKRSYDTACFSGRRTSKHQNSKLHLLHRFPRRTRCCWRNPKYQGSTTVTGVYILGTVIGLDGTQIEQSHCQVSGQFIVPQQKASFLMEFAQSPNGLGQWTTSQFSSISLVVAQATPTNQHGYSDFSLSDLSYYVDTGGNLSGVYWATGKVTNIGNQNAQGVVIFATYYNATGAVVGVGYTDSTTLSPTALSPGESASFKVGPWDLDMFKVSSDRQIATYNLLVQVSGPIINDTGAPPTVPPTATIGPASSPPPTQNSGSNQFSLTNG